MSKRKIKKSYNRILEISEDAKQITLPDSRYYRRNGKYYPSITYVLSYYPKGKHFEDWLKKVGYSADWIKRKAGEELTRNTGSTIIVEDTQSDVSSTRASRSTASVASSLPGSAATSATASASA